MVDLQLISKVIETGSLDILLDNNITTDYFPEYEEEIQFIFDHFEKYGNVPDKNTFLSHFDNLELPQVNESDRYLIDTIREEHLFESLVPVIQRSSELIKDNSNTAVEYLLSQIKRLEPNYGIGGTDIVAQAQQRFEQYKERKNHQDAWFFTTGFEELDGAIHGIQREEELFVIYARTNQGKSFVLEKVCTHIWEIGFNVGYISPEMSANSIGYRFDTLYKNFSNKGLMWGKDTVEEDEYEDYIQELQKRTNQFIVAAPKDRGFDGKITVSKLRNWVKQYNLQMIAIDGITYLTDERYKKGDNKTTMLTNISEDLMSLSVELKIPILVVVQANRSGIVDKDSDGTPELESIRDSDGIAMNASKVLSIRQTKEGVLIMEIKKQRFGPVGVKVSYNWDIDTGTFTYISSADDTTETADEVKTQRRKQQTAKEDVF